MQNKVEKIAAALLYEGYLLYPYRKSALKNQQRFNFGLLEPNDYFQTQVLIKGHPKTIKVELRFLQLQKRIIVDGEGINYDKLEIAGQIFESWDEAVERRIQTDQSIDFHIKAERSEELLANGAAKYTRRSEEIKGRIGVLTELVGEDLQRLTVKIENTSQSEKLIATHAILSVENAEFISLLEYGDDFKETVKALIQKNLFPVLIERNVMLASPIILYDYPQIAPESAVDFYDATEIDELLTLRILTLTEAEKREAISLDPRVGQIFRKAEISGLMNLHGVIRENALKIGQRVRLKPKNSADAFDLFLKDQIAVIESIEEDFEDRKYYSVVLEADEGRDLGHQKFIGHRFFFSEAELEIL